MLSVGCGKDWETVNEHLSAESCTTVIVRRRRHECPASPPRDLYGVCHAVSAIRWRAGVDRAGPAHLPSAGGALFPPPHAARALAARGRAGRDRRVGLGRRVAATIIPAGCRGADFP